MQRFINTMMSHPSTYLLCLQLLSLILHPMLDNSPYNQAILVAFNVAALSMAIGVVNRSPALTWVAWALAVPAILFTLLYLVWNKTTLLLIAQLLESILFFYTAIGLVWYMLDDHVITPDELISAATTFTVLAWGFALLYAICQTIYPGSITGLTNPDEPRSWVDLIFFSFSILSGTGYGDITAVHPAAKIIVTFQMFIGLMYMALIVSKLVGMTTIKKH